MTLSEFKAWFSGYTEDMEGPPSAKQWKRIKKVVKDIDGNTVTERIYLDRYYPHRWSSSDYFTCTGSSISDSTWSSTDTLPAMYSAGKAEAGYV